MRKIAKQYKPQGMNWQAKTKLPNLASSNGGAEYRKIRSMRARTAKADSNQVNAEKILTVTGSYPNCQTQEKIGNYWSLSAYLKAKVENKVFGQCWKTRVWQQDSSESCSLKLWLKKLKERATLGKLRKTTRKGRKLWKPSGRKSEKPAT